jgi:hypothetical protein
MFSPLKITFALLISSVVAERSATAADDFSCSQFNKNETACRSDGRCSWCVPPAADSSKYSQPVSACLSRTEVPWVPPYLLVCESTASHSLSVKPAGSRVHTAMWQQQQPQHQHVHQLRQKATVAAAAEERAVDDDCDDDGRP